MSEKSNTEIAAYNQRGIVITSLPQLIEFAEVIHQSGLAPSSLKGRTPEESSAKIMVALQMGAEIGLPPLSSLQNVAVVNGRPSIWGDAMLGVVRASGLLQSIKEEVIGEAGKDSRGYRCTVQRQGEEPLYEEFTIKDAVAAGLWGKTGPWTQYPKRMLKYRARAFALRDAFPDILRGLRSTEELQDVEAERNVTPPDLLPKEEKEKVKKAACAATGCRKRESAPGARFCADHTEVEAPPSPAPNQSEVANLPLHDGPFPQDEEEAAKAKAKALLEA